LRQGLAWRGVAWQAASGFLKSFTRRSNADVVAWFFVWHLLGRNGFKTVETLWNLNRLEGKA
jgi:hypothetical protein